MAPLIQESPSHATPEALVESLRTQDGIVLLRSGILDVRQGRSSFVLAQPFLRFRSYGSRCEIETREGLRRQFGNPWQVLDGLIARYELLEQVDLPLPLGGCFGYWGYDLKNFVEPGPWQRATNDLELPDCHLGFYSALVAFDHSIGKTWIISTGLQPDGSRSDSAARAQSDFWKRQLLCAEAFGPAPESEDARRATVAPVPGANISRRQFLDSVEKAQRYIRAGDIYQVNLSQRFAAQSGLSGWRFYQRLADVSPAPFAAYLDCGDFQIASSSPELFLRMSAGRISTRPIKGTRPRASDETRDTQLAYELQTSPKELAELVMITDLLRNDLGRICEFGSVHVPELVRLERYAYVQHLVSTIEGQLRDHTTHLSALASCFPGGSITGAPKVRAMEIIDELEPVTRGPYTGALGYLGFNHESQLSILIRAAVTRQGMAYFHSGAGIVADSVPEAEYAETLAKARGFFDSIGDARCMARLPTPKAS